MPSLLFLSGHDLGHHVFSFDLFGLQFKESLHLADTSCSSYLISLFYVWQLFRSLFVERAHLFLHGQPLVLSLGPFQILTSRLLF